MKRYASGPRDVVALLLLAVLSVVAFAAPASAAAIATTTEVEPNNTAATATLLTLDGGRAIGAGAILAGDSDYWRINGVPAGARIWAYIDTGGVQAQEATSRDSLMKLYAGDGTTLIEADDDDGTANGLDGILDATAGPSLGSAIAGRVLLAGGTYYVRLDGIDGTAVISPYTLYVVVSTAAQTAAESEPNNSAAAVAAQPVLSGSTTLAVRDAAIGVAGDQDYYAVSLTAGDILIMMADADPARTGTGIDVVIELLGTDGTSVLLTCDD